MGRWSKPYSIAQAARKVPVRPFPAWQWTTVRVDCCVEVAKKMSNWIWEGGCRSCTGRKRFARGGWMWEGFRGCSRERVTMLVKPKAARVERWMGLGWEVAARVKGRTQEK